MRKILLLVGLIISINCFSQVKTLQNVVTVFNGAVTIGYTIDALENLEYITVDSVSVCPEYRAFITMCNTLSSHTTTSFVVQNTVEQTGDENNPQRIIIRWTHRDQIIVNYNDLSTTNKAKYNSFVTKCFSKL